MIIFMQPWKPVHLSSPRTHPQPRAHPHCRRFRYRPMPFRPRSVAPHSQGFSLTGKTELSFLLHAPAERRGSAPKNRPLHVREAAPLVNVAVLCAISGSGVDLARVGIPSTRSSHGFASTISPKASFGSPSNLRRSSDKSKRRLPKCRYPNGIDGYLLGRIGL